MFRHPTPSLGHRNVLSYVDVIRRDTSVGDRVAIIGAWGIWLNAKMLMEEWGLDITNKARAGGCYRRSLPKAEKETAKTTRLHWLFISCEKHI